MDMPDDIWLTEMLESPFEINLQHSERLFPYAAFSPCNNTSQTKLKTSNTEHGSCSVPIKSSINKESKETNTKPSVPNKNLSFTQDHAISERKRREKLSQQFIALSAMVPGLKKIDKSSILESLIKYITELEESVKILQEKTSKKTIESAVFVDNLKISPEDDSSTSSDSPLPEIQTKVLDRNILIQIHCENNKGVLAKTLLDVEKLKLSIVNYYVTPLGSATFDVTILTKMEEGFNITVKDLLLQLQSSLACHP